MADTVRAVFLGPDQMFTVLGTQQVHHLLPILRCAGKPGNPFQTTQGNCLSCRDQEGRRGSEEAVPGPSVFPSEYPGVGNFPGCL